MYYSGLCRTACLLSMMRCLVYLGTFEIFGSLTPTLVLSLLHQALSAGGGPSLPPSLHKCTCDQRCNAVEMRCLPYTTIKPFPYQTILQAYIWLVAVGSPMQGVTSVLEPWVCNVKQCSDMDKSCAVHLSILERLHGRSLGRETLLLGEFHAEEVRRLCKETNESTVKKILCRQK